MGGLVHKKALLGLIILFLVILSISIISANNAPIFGNFKESKKLAKLYNEENISYDKAFAKEYLKNYNNFTNIDFKKETKLDMKVGAKNDNIKGVSVEDENYAIHLIYCDHKDNSCVFRVNGVPTGKIYQKDKVDKKNKFSISSASDLEIESIQFDYCDGKRFCNVFFEAYDKVEVRVKEK